MQDELTIPRPQYLALLQLLRTAESLWNASRVFFAQWELSPSQFNILNLLHQKTTGSTQIDLSRDLIMHRSNVTGLVDRLENRGLVKRTEDPSDRRAYRVILTPEGNLLLGEILPHYYAAAEAVWKGIDENHTSQLLAELATVAANAERMAITTPLK